MTIDPMSTSRRKECKRSSLLLPLLSVGAAAGILLSLFLPATSLDISKNTYFMKIDTRFILEPDAVDRKIRYDSPERKAALDRSDPSKYGLKDFYTLSIFNTCQGTFAPEGTEERDIWRLEQCGKKSLNFKFQPAALFKESLKALPDEEKLKLNEIFDAEEYLEKTWRGMLIAFCFAFIANAIVFLLGFIGIIWKWGASIEAFFGFFATVGTFVAAVVSSMVFKRIQTAFQAHEKIMAVRTVVSMRAMGWTWLAFAFSFVSFLLYLWQTSCCSTTRYSGRENTPSPTSEKKRLVDEEGYDVPLPPPHVTLPALPRYSSGYNKVDTRESTYGYQPTRDRD